MGRKSTLVPVRGLLCVGLLLGLLVGAGCGATAPTPSETPVPTATPSTTPLPAQRPEPNIPTQNQTVENQGPKVVSKEDSQKIAEFLRSSPTFRFDGIENTIKLIGSGYQENTSRWEFHYEFDSRHAGYGDRTGKILAQVITSHRAQIVVEQGEIVDAVLDGKWDMLRQKIIE